MKIRARAPVRLGFGGGGTDVSPYTEEFGGAVLNATINKYCWASLEFRNDNKIHLHSYDYDMTVSLDSIKSIEYNGQLDLIKAVIKRMYSENRGFNLYLRSDVPPASGVGGSAAAFVSVIGVFNHLKEENKLTPYEIAELAYELERKELKIHGGRQDQYACVFGGINLMEFKGNDFVRVTPLRLKKDIIFELEKRLLLIRIDRRNEDVLSEQKKNVESGKTIDSMHKTKEFAYLMKEALLAGNIDKFGEILHNSWQEKKRFGSKISNKNIDELYDLALKNGAIGGKLSGAGGGGHMIFISKDGCEVELRSALKKAGAEIIDYTFDTDGLQTWEI